jgi:hypothetical protein
MLSRGIFVHGFCVDGVGMTFWCAGGVHTVLGDWKQKFCFPDYWFKLAVRGRIGGSKFPKVPLGCRKWLFLELDGDVGGSQGQFFFACVRSSMNPEFGIFLWADSYPSQKIFRWSILRWKCRSLQNQKVGWCSRSDSAEWWFLRS